MTSRAIAAAGLIFAVVLGAASCSPRPVRLEERPNILLIVIDTLRADHLPFHGYHRDTAPRLRKLLAEGGVVFENAYAPAAWTAPSVAAIQTGKDPSRLVPRHDLRGFSVPGNETTIAEHLREAGYETAGFVGNLFLHAGMGFGQGFEKYWVVPGGYESIPKPAETVLEPAMAWLETRRENPEPYFLYVHFMDPHDPYTSPRLVDGRSEYFPDYSGPIRGEHVHPLNQGSMQLSGGLAEDIQHLRALYDSEILHVDQAAARLIEAAEELGGRETVVVLLSDHGEEIRDHGGWTHGRTLYQEIAHVPLAVRVAGKVPGGRRIAANVTAVDVAPTLLAAAGVSGEDLDGVDLLPAILDPLVEPPRRPIFIRHWQRGPIRAALVVDQRKTMVFNHRQPFSPEPGVEANTAAEDLRRLPRFASFDLAVDPSERRPAMPSADDIETVYSFLDPTLDGVRVVLRGIEEGRTASGTLRFSAAPTGTLPLFLADADEVRVVGSSVTFRLTGEAPPKGFLVLGVPGTLEAVELDPGLPIAVEVGGGATWSGLPVADGALRRSSWPRWSNRASLRIWSRESRALAPERPLDAETRAKLQALGYL